MKKFFFITISIILVLSGIFIIRKLFLPPICKVGIVIDDFGYNLNNLDALFKIKLPVTLAILPNLKYSRRVLEEAKHRRYETILHMPMEPKLGAEDNQIKLEQKTILVKMSREEILETLRQAIESLPGIKGVSNHMGSKATSDYRVMKTVLSELKKEDLYFLDSLVTNRSLCRRVSREVEIGFAERDVFLDGNLDPEYIRNQFNRLIGIAKEKKEAVGICHDRQNTISVLKEMMPYFKKQGVKFVFLSELVR